MLRRSVRFEGQHGSLAGSIELPATEPSGFALFAHCFTCGKNSVAASRISRALALRGIGTLRFDFTGLGDSDGELANAGFSANIDDLVAAADFMRAEFEAPTLLVGHSLGGTAVLAAASRIPEAKAVVTIGAPASPEHVVAQFGADIERIQHDGVGDVSIAGRSFRISREFIDELRSTSLEDVIRGLRRALLIMHSPVDAIVEIGEATKIFAAALHPKSFVSLDAADHLLLEAEDAQFVADTIAAWAARYVSHSPDESAETVAPRHVRVDERNQRFLRRVYSDDHVWLSDEPEGAGGDNLGPDPYEHLLAALGTCTSMTMRMYANHKEWPMDDVTIELEHLRDHGEDCERCDEPGQVIDVIKRRIHIDGDLSAEQRERLLQIADRCPVHRTLTGDLRIESESCD